MCQNFSSRQENVRGSKETQHEKGVRVMLLEPWVGELDSAKSSLYQAHGNEPGCQGPEISLVCLCSVLLLPLSLGKQCNENETFSLDALIKITYWIRSKTTGATSNLLCLLFGDPVHRGARGHSSSSGNHRTNQRRSLFFLGIFQIPSVLNIHKSSWIFPKVFILWLF